MRSGKPLPTISRLREALSFDAESGVFRWVNPAAKATRVRVGDQAGSIDGGYVYITLDGARFAAHQAVVAVTTGRWPTCAVDHRDGDGLNNRPDNIREASGGMNQQNQRCAHARNVTGLLGVVFLPGRRSPKKYRAQIWHNGIAKNLGYFLLAEEAHARYVAAKRELHEGCTL